MNKVQEFAQKYIDNGLRPIPLYHPTHGCKCTVNDGCDEQCYGKVPKDSSWADKTFKASDFDEVSNIALAMGKQPSGDWLLGIDVDGELPWNWFNNLPQTLESVTGRGKHLIYKVRPDSFFGNWKDVFGTRDKETGYKKGFNGAVDLRYCRGALVVPPSLHKSGAEYKWKNFMNPAELPLNFQRDLLSGRKRVYPEAKSYFYWSQSPSHKNKKP